MPIYLAEELPDLPDYSAINRAVPQMPSGMEKEEESVSILRIYVLSHQNYCVSAIMFQFRIPTARGGIFILNRGF